MKRAEYIFTCDLCDEEEKSRTDKSPAHWVTLKIARPYADRHVVEKHICDECCLGIKKLHEAS